MRRHADGRRYGARADARPSPPLLHRNRQAAEIDIDLQADLLAGQRQPRALLVLQHNDLPAGADRDAAADGDIDAGDVVRAADVGDGAAKARARGAEHQARAQAADRDRVAMSMKKQRAAAA